MSWDIQVFIFILVMFENVRYADEDRRNMILEDKKKDNTPRQRSMSSVFIDIWKLNDI